MSSITFIKVEHILSEKVGQWKCLSVKKKFMIISGSKHALPIEKSLLLAFIYHSEVYQLWIFTFIHYSTFPQNYLMTILQNDHFFLIKRLRTAKMRNLKSFILYLWSYQCRSGISCQNINRNMDFQIFMALKKPKSGAH